VLASFTTVLGFFAQIGEGSPFPLPKVDLDYEFSDRYAKSSVAVEDGFVAQID